MKLEDGGVTDSDGMLAVLNWMITLPDAMMVAEVTAKLVGMGCRAVTQSFPS